MVRFLMALFAGLIFAQLGSTADAPKRLLLVTHSGGFIHDSLGVAEDIVTELGPKRGYAVTCWRYTGDRADPSFEKYREQFRARTGKPVEPENCGRINRETLKKFDLVVFFTSGSGRNTSRKDIGPLTPEELQDLKDWVNEGGAFAGVHCATDTLYESKYGDFIGAYFRTHPAIQRVKLRVEDPKHPAAAGMNDGMEWHDEFYIFHDEPFSREKVRVIFSIDKDTFDLQKSPPRKDGDYALAWVKNHGAGRVFYTALGHRKEVWKDERFQQHLFGGLDWAVGLKPGAADPVK